MWVSRALRRGCVRMRRIFSIGRTTTVLPPVSFPFIGPVLNRDAFMRTTLREGDRYRLLQQGDLFTSSDRLLTCQSQMPKTKSG